jgi:hypothetical protein
MSDSNRYFSPDYQTARKRFRDAVAGAGGHLDSLPLAVTGPDHEDLSIDIGWFGANKPQCVLVHSSGVHGVEGFAGSAIQLQWLTGGIAAPPADAAIVLVHMLNPYGAAWSRRVNENNVDLNRNFGEPQARDENVARGYAALDALLNPPSPPCTDLFYARAAWLVCRDGMAKLRRAVIGGQTVNARGLFYKGEHLEPGPAAYQRYLASKLTDTKRIVAIDVHTGYGRYGEDTLMIDAAPNRARVNAGMRNGFGDCVALSDGSSSTYHVDGTQQDMYSGLVPDAEVYFATQEFGTLHSLRVLAALRAENRWHHYGSGAFEHASRRRLQAVFCPVDDAWRANVLRRGREVIVQAQALAFACAEAAVQAGGGAS